MLLSHHRSVPATRQMHMFASLFRIREPNTVLFPCPRCPPRIRLVLFPLNPSVNPTRQHSCRLPPFEIRTTSRRTYHDHVRHDLSPTRLSSIPLLFSLAPIRRLPWNYLPSFFFTKSLPRLTRRQSDLPPRSNSYSLPSSAFPVTHRSTFLRSSPFPALMCPISHSYPFAIHRGLISLARRSFLPSGSPFAQHVQINTLYTAISRNHSNDRLHPPYDNQTPPSTEYYHT